MTFNLEIQNVEEVAVVVHTVIENCEVIIPS
jgi:hypothetical protein